MAAGTGGGSRFASVAARTLRSQSKSSGAKFEGVAPFLVAVGVFKSDPGGGPPRAAVPWQPERTDMSPSEVAGHYSCGNLVARLNAALAEDGVDPDSPKIETLAPCDQFHSC